MKKIQNKNICSVRRPAYTTGAFTLIELIVVITILAILGTIAFISLQGYSKSSRDSVRLSDIASIKKSLELFQARTGQYPDPTEAQAITYSGALAWYQGSFGNSTYTNVEKLNKLPVDPLTGLEYTYSVINTGKYYEIAGILETKDVVLAVPQPSYAKASDGATANALVTGTYNGLALRVNTETTSYILAVPSLITSIDLSVENNRKLETIIPNKALVIKNQTNLPSNYQNTVYNKDGEADNPDFKVIKDNSIDNIVVYEGDIEDLTAEELVDKFQEAYEGTTIDELSITNEFKSLDTTDIDQAEQVDVYGVSFINAYLGGSAVTRIYNTCSYDETTYPHNTTKSFYSGTGVTFTVGTCDGIKQDYICKDGAWKDGNSNADLETYQYTNCEVEGARTCTYLETEFNHGEDMDVYSQDSIDFGEDLVCDDVKGTVTCNDSIVGGHNTYGYKVCVKGDPIGCDAQPTYSYNGHEYNISILDHGDTSSGTIQESENNGTYEYTLTVTCNNGSYTAESEIGPDLVSCDTNYTAEGELCKSDCLADTYDGYDYTDIIHLETQEVNKDTSPTNGTQETTATLTCSGGTVSVSNEVAGSVTCDTGYYLDGSLCNSQRSGDATSGYVFKNTSGVVQYPKDCSDLLEETTWKNTLAGSPYNGSSFSNGVYYIKPSTTAFKAYCDMTSDGGGWTMVLAQYEADPVTNWNEGIQGDYDPSLVTTKGFALNTGELPEHNQIGLGKDLTATYVDYVNGIYSNGDIDVTLVKSPKTDYEYEIYRSSVSYFDWHNPEESNHYGDGLRENTLTIDKTGGKLLTWAFSPKQTTIGARSYSMNGIFYGTTSEDFAWTIWVRKSSGKFLIGDNGGFRWNDGTYGISCKDYLDSNYYDGEGDGVYWIKPDLNPKFKVYCDMTTDGGGWTSLVRINPSINNSNYWKLNVGTESNGYYNFLNTSNRFSYNEIYVNKTIGWDEAEFYFEKIGSDLYARRGILKNKIVSKNWSGIKTNMTNWINHQYINPENFDGIDYKWLLHTNADSDSLADFPFFVDYEAGNYAPNDILFSNNGWGGRHYVDDVVANIFIRDTTNEKSLKLYDGAYRYDDGLYAESCLGYLESNYYNNEGNGLYRLKQGSDSAYKVYCDMVIDGGGRILAAVIDSSNNSFSGWTLDGELWNNNTIYGDINDAIGLTNYKSDLFNSFSGSEIIYAEITDGLNTTCYDIIPINNSTIFDRFNTSGTASVTTKRENCYTTGWSVNGDRDVLFNRRNLNICDGRYIVKSSYGASFGSINYIQRECSTIVYHYPIKVGLFIK